MKLRWEKCETPNPRRYLRAWTKRRIAAAKRAVKREQAALPLFPELQRYQTVQDRMAEIDADGRELCVRMRSFNAKCWRTARRQLRAMPAITRAGLIRYWNEFEWLPPTPTNLLEMIREAKYQSPWRWIREKKLLAKHKPFTLYE